MARRIGQIGWCICLAGLPFAPFLDKKLDLWHMQTIWVQGWLVVLWALTFFSGTRRTVTNHALSIWILWIGLWSWFSWWATLREHQVYPVLSLMPVIHCLLLVLFYWTALQQWSSEVLRELFKWISYSAVILVVYGYLQLFNLDQFFAQLSGGDKDVLVGTIGNVSHFSAYLACTVPIVLYRKGRRWKLAVLAYIGLFSVFLIKYKSLGGVCAASLAVLWCAWFWHRRLWIWLVLLAVIAAAASIYWIPDVLSSSGRIEAWVEYWQHFVKAPITGRGPGFVMALSQKIEVGPINHWRHVHNEYFQIALEQGLVGLGIVLWGLWRVVRLIRILPKTDELVVCVGILIAFLFNCLVNFPMHLWMVGSLGLLGYCGIYVLATEGRYGIKDTKRVA